VLVPISSVAHANHSWAVISVYLAMLIPLLEAIHVDHSWSIISVPLAVLILPFNVFSQATWWPLSGQLAQRLIGRVIMDQAVNVIWLADPDMQLAVFLVNGWVLPELFCRQVCSVPAAVRLVIDHRLFAALFLGYWEITNPCHCLLCSVAVFVVRSLTCSSSVTFSPYQYQSRLPSIHRMAGPSSRCSLSCQYQIWVPSA
jgi:hypothetical protein